MSSSSLTIFLLILVAIRSSAAVTSPPSTAYSILRSYNFPPGILPEGATSYTLDPATGKFTVNFDGTCSFSLQGSYDIRYKSQISGRISNNKLRDLKGVSVKILLFWVNIVDVERSGNDLDFSVGIASATFSIENFEVVPQCGCGLDCGLDCGNGVDPNPIKLRVSF